MCCQLKMYGCNVEFSFFVVQMHIYIIIYLFVYFLFSHSFSQSMIHAFFHSIITQ